MIVDILVLFPVLEGMLSTFLPLCLLVTALHIDVFPYWVHIHYLANKSPSSQGYDFSSGLVWMLELDCEESWAPRNWCFWTVVLEKTLSPFYCKKILKKISPGYSLEGLMLKLKLQYFGHLMWRADPLEKTPMLRKIEGRTRTGQQRMRWSMASPTWWTGVWVNSGSCWWTGWPRVLWSMGSQRVRHRWVTELNWTDIQKPAFKRHFLVLQNPTYWRLFFPPHLNDSPT